jgi:hypothetical protein
MMSLRSYPAAAYPWEAVAAYSFCEAIQRPWETRGRQSVTKGRQRRAEKATRILQRNNAQEILKALDRLEGRRTQFASRWLWELVQNARDFPEPERPMAIKIAVTSEQVRFAHNGRAFTEDEVLSLIYHGSTKQESPEQLGKFGTGFLSTHLLSRKVRVRGALVEETGESYGFEFVLDRSGKDAIEVGEAMGRSVEAFERSIAEEQIVPSEWTEFVYDLSTSNGNDDGQISTQFQLDAVPYVLAFDHTIESIEIDLPGQASEVYRLESEEEVSHGTSIATINHGSDHIRLALARDQDASVAVPIAIGEGGRSEVLSWPAPQFPASYK